MERGNGEDDVKRRAINAKSLDGLFFPECNVSPRGQDAVNRLSTPPVLLTSVLYSSIMIHTIFTSKESDFSWLELLQ